MATQDSLTVDVPNFKLAKVGKDRERRRAGGGWWGARGAASGFSGAIGGAEAGAGGFLGSGMSLAKVLTVLLLSGGISAGAWQVGNMIAGTSAAGGKAAPKVFADKEKYGDLSGVIKGDHSIPNSLGYVNNDGLTDEQRAAKKAAEEAAAKKAAEDAKNLADADAKKKALADAAAAKADSAPAPAPSVLRKGLIAGKFGAGFGGNALAGGSGLSGGISRGFAPTGASGLADKAQSGNLTGYNNSAAKVASAQSSLPRAAAGKGAIGQLFGANNMSHAGAASAANGQTETGAAGAGVPFDNNAGQGTAITGQGLGDGGSQPGGSGGGAPGGSSSGGGPINGGACSGAGEAPDANGNCVSQTPSPSGSPDAPYQSLIDVTMVLLAIVGILSFLTKTIPVMFQQMVCGIIAALGGVIALIGLRIATMSGGDMVIGGIVAAVGGYISYSAYKAVVASFNMGNVAVMGAGPLIAAAVGELAAASTKMSSISMM